MDRFGSNFDNFVSKSDSHEYEIQRLKYLATLPEGHIIVDDLIVHEPIMKFRFMNDYQF